MKSESKWIDAGEWLKNVSDSWMYANLAKKIIREAPRVEAFGHWIPVSEKKPTVADEYVVMIQGAASPTTLYYLPSEDIFFTETEGDTVTYRVTHWMPLPEAPKKEGE